MNRQMHYILNRCFAYTVIFPFISFAVCSCSTSYQTEEIEYDHGDIHISARIYIPPGEGKFPAVVLVPSAEPDTKDTYSEYAEHFASHGIVTISYDKRGSGNTNGNIWKADFDDLLGDALAGIGYLKYLPYVDTTRMGFLGHSQGGMYIFKSEKVSDDVAFVIDLSGSPNTPLSQSHYNISSKIAEYGGTPDYADSLAVLMDRYIVYLKTRTNYESIKSSHDRLIVHPQKPVADKINYFTQFTYLKPPDSLPPFDDMEMYPFMRSNDFEPGVFYPGLSIPALVVYGGKDRVIPSAVCAQRARQLQQLNNLIDVKVYENANHAMKESSALGQKYPDGFLDYLSNWIKGD